MKKRNIIALISFLFFIILTILVLTSNTTEIDESIYQTIYGFRSNTLDIFFRAITEFANPIPVFILFTILVIVLKRKDEILISVNLLSTVLINQALKYIIQRIRPDHIRLINQGGYSYPSGHSMVALALYSSLIYLCIKRIKEKKLRITLIVLLSLLIVLVGISRIYLGVHYPSDVLAGYLLTISIIVVSTTLTNNYLGGKKNDKDGNQ